MPKLALWCSNRQWHRCNGYVKASSSVNAFATIRPNACLSSFEMETALIGFFCLDLPLFSLNLFIGSKTFLEPFTSRSSTKLRKHSLPLLVAPIISLTVPPSTSSPVVMHLAGPAENGLMPYKHNLDFRSETCFKCNFLPLLVDSLCCEDILIWDAFSKLHEASRVCELC